MNVPDQSTVEKHKDWHSRLNIHIALANLIIQRKFEKIQGKISKVIILKFLAVKPIHKLFNGIGLQS